MVSSLFTVLFVTFLGFTDDVLEWPWVCKILLPVVATLPTMAAYDGPTDILCPKFLRPLIWDPTLTVHPAVMKALAVLGVRPVQESISGLIQVSYLYYAYMCALSVFTSNSINIYAGVNGLEVGQSIVVSVFLLLHNVTEISNGSSGSEGHWFSVIMLVPFASCSCALLVYNWYPARVFVGDTYCYFAGVVFSVSAIHGHYSKTLLLFLVPQIFNFLISLPQLFKVVECPRHRLPRHVKSTDKMTTSTRSDGVVNFTLVNFVLKAFGDMHEERLTMACLAIQTMTTAIVAMAVRHGIWRKLFFDEEL